MVGANLLLIVSIGMLFGSISFESQACSAIKAYSYCVGDCLALCDFSYYDCYDDGTCPSEAELGCEIIYNCEDARVDTSTKKFMGTTSSCNGITVGAV